MLLTFVFAIVLCTMRAKPLTSLLSPSTLVHGKHVALQEAALRALEGRVQHIVRVVGKGVDENGRHWLILQPFGEPMPSVPAKTVIQNILHVAEIIGELAQEGWSQGDISYNNIQIFPDGHAVDFG
jgi:hypothetical protein